MPLRLPSDRVQTQPRRQHSGPLPALRRHRPLPDRGPRTARPPRSRAHQAHPAALIHPHDTVWKHQALAIDELNLGKNVVVATPTASGKTLVFHLHTLSMLHHDPQAATLVLYPAKALANDQPLRWKQAATSAGLSPDCIKQITGDAPSARDSSYWPPDPWSS